METIKDTISFSALQEMAQKMHGDFVKVIVDVEKEIMAIDAPLHSDLLELLVKEESSEPKNLWGINLYPNEQEENFIEFDSLMNVKPGLGNRTRNVEDVNTREKIEKIVKNLVKK